MASNQEHFEKYDLVGSGVPQDSEKGLVHSSVEVVPVDEDAGGVVPQSTHRGLKPRHLQVMAISGAIGTGLFVGTGSALARAGPLSLLLGYLVYGALALATFNAMGEMVTYLPIDGSFITFATRWVDPSYGFALGWVYTYNNAVIVAAEVVAVAGMINFWNDTVSNAVWCAMVIASIIVMNLSAIKYFGEALFWFSISKIILIIGLLFFTLIVMCGGNPEGDAFGFRYWKDPGPMVEYLTDGSLGHFAGFWSILVAAAYAYGGPDYIAFAAGETKSPRRILPSVFRRVIYRLLFFYVGGVLAVGILVPSDDPDLGGDAKGAGSSPFVLASVRLGIPVLPHIINAVLMTSAWSCGIELTFATSRCLYGLALNGSAPKVLTKLHFGVPFYATLIVVCFSLLSFMSVSNSAATAFNWLVNLVGSGQLLIYGLVHVIYFRWHGAMKAQGFRREDLPWKRRGQIYMSWAAVLGYAIVYITNGFTVFVKGHWAVPDFIFAYFSLVAFVGPYLGHKIYTRQWRWPALIDVDITTDKAEIDMLEEDDEPVPNTLGAKINRRIWG